MIKQLLNQPRALSTDEIEEIINYSGVPGFLGVFARDTLPSGINEGESMIINLNKANQGGSHWVAVYCGADYCEYFDSFGIIAPPEIRKMCYTSGKPAIYSTNSIQNINSILCGYYSIYFILMRNLGVDMYDIIYQFEINNDKKNDKVLMKQLKKKLL